MFDSSASASWSGKLIGVAEYDNNPSNNPIVIKLETGGGSDWFIGFNRATGPHSDNVQADNLVTIYQVMDGNGNTYSTSSLKGVLGSGNHATISNWREAGFNLVISVNEINTNASPGYASIDITFGDGETPSPAPPGFGSDSFTEWLATPAGITFLAVGSVMILCVLLCFCANRFRDTKRSLKV